jgi:hypothetical protein
MMSESLYCTLLFEHVRDDDDPSDVERVFNAHAGEAPQIILDRSAEGEWPNACLFDPLSSQLAPRGARRRLLDEYVIAHPFHHRPEKGTRMLVTLTEPRALALAEAMLGDERARASHRDASSLARTLLKGCAAGLVTVDDEALAALNRERRRREAGNPLWPAVVELHDETVRAFNSLTPGARETPDELWRQVLHLRRLLVERERLAYADLTRAELLRLVWMRKLRGWHYQSTKGSLIGLLERHERTAVG